LTRALTTIYEPYLGYEFMYVSESVDDVRECVCEIELSPANAAAAAALASRIFAI